jgi:hypothetical protein
MRISIEKQIDAETKEVWSFNLFDLSAVFVGWQREVKPIGKRKWVTDYIWDKYGRANHNTVNEPVLPDDIRSEVISEIMKYIKVRTWDEWKAS